jgi:hypothetical protein
MAEIYKATYNTLIEEMVNWAYCDSGSWGEHQARDRIYCNLLKNM